MVIHMVMSIITTIHTMSITEFLPLIQSLDALFPVGGFTLSNGLETYVQKNIVCDKETLIKFLKAYLYVASYNDIAFCVKAAMGADVSYLDRICTSCKTPREVRNGGMKMCSRFLKAHEAISGSEQLKQYAELIKKSECAGHHCIAVGLLIREKKLDINMAAGLYAYNILSTMTNHAVKLVPLRQLDGQKALAETAKGIEKAVQTAIKIDIDDLGASGAGFDIRAMQHEKLYSRLYIS